MLGKSVPPSLVSHNKFPHRSMAKLVDESAINRKATK